MQTSTTQVNNKQAFWIGALQGLCLPFRGFSRSGATISTGMLAGVQKARAEDFSFALAVILTPPAIARELWRLHQTQHAGIVMVNSSTGPGWCSVRLSGRSAGVEMAEPLARDGALVSIRDLLPACGCRGGVSLPRGVLSPGQPRALSALLFASLQLSHATRNHPRQSVNFACCLCRTPAKIFRLRWHPLI